MCRRQLLSLLLCLTKLNAAVADVTTFLKGDVTTVTDVGEQANITLDVRDMHRALEKGDFASARDIYKNGKHAGSYKLSHFSFGAYDHLKDDELFLYHVYGLAKGNIENVAAYYTYADKFIEELLKDTSTGTLASEAVKALHLWMWVAHKIHHGFRDCKNGHLKADKRAFDEAMAYWIGAGQGHKIESGWGLFELTTEAEFDFGQRDANSHEFANANNKIIDLYGKARMYMSAENPCVTKGAINGFYDVRNQMLSAMRIPLMQKLIHALIKNDKQRIKLYSLSIVPQIAACRPAAHLYLQTKLVEVENYNPNKDYTTVLQQLQSSFDCLGFTCDDIGSYQAVIMPECADPPGDIPLASYVPENEVFGYSKIDLDVLQIKILTLLRANETAYDIYSIGKNGLNTKYGETRHSLQHMATSSSRNRVPRFQIFKEFYSKVNYADIEISMALKEAGRYGELYDSNMRSAVVTYTAVYQILYMYALEKFWESLEACNDKEKKDYYKYDEAVSLLIGSLEGPSIGYADINDGISFYNLANRNCFQFGTCDEISGVSRLSLVLLKDLGEGAEHLKNHRCKKLEKNLNKIQDLLLVPILQSIVKYAERSENYPPNELSTDLAMGEVAALSVIPILSAYADDQEDVTRVTVNMLIQQNAEPIADGVVGVANALENSFSHMNISCALFGRMEGISLCGDEEYIQAVGEFNIHQSSDSSRFKTSFKVSVSVSILVIISIFI